MLMNETFVTHYRCVFILLIFITCTITYTPCTTSVAYRDGPVGLPDGINVRQFNNNRRRHVKKVDKVEKIIEDQVVKELNKEINKADVELDEFNKSFTDVPEDLKYTPSEEANNLTFTPEWINYLPTSMTSAKYFLLNSLRSLSRLGLTTILSSNVFKDSICNPLSSEIDKIVCMTRAIDNTNKIITDGILVLTLNYRILSGGKMADAALTSMNTLADDPDNVTLLKILGTTATLYVTLMREIVSDETKVIAGSIMTKITGLPVVTNVADSSSGGFGRVNVILPRPTRVHRVDYDMAKLKSGSDEKYLLSSN